MELHDELSNPEILTLVVYLLGGTTVPVDLEDAAIEAFKLAPKKFSWIKYDDRIDLRIVHYSLQNACKPNMKYLKGSSRHGYMLTQTGLNWAKQFDEKKQLTTTSRKMSPSDLILKERIRLENTRAYQKFIAGEKDKITIMEFREFTRGNDYFPKHIKDQRYEKIENTVRENDDLKKTWEFLKKKFSKE